MSLLQTGITEVTSILGNQTFSIEFGESTSVSYTDTALTTSHLTKTTYSLSVSNNIITFDFELENTEGNGDDYDSILINMNTKPTAKFKHNAFSKDSNTAVIYSTKLIQIPDYN